MLTLTEPEVEATTGDDDEDLIHCALPYDENLAYCGADLTGEEWVTGAISEDEKCPKCVEILEMEGMMYAHGMD